MGDRGLRISLQGPLERLFRGVTEAFSAFLCLGGVMIPLGWVRLFLGGFSVVVVGQEFGVSLWVSKGFWQQLVGGSFNGDPLLWDGIRLFLYGFRGCGFWFTGDDGRRGNARKTGLRRSFTGHCAAGSLRKIAKFCCGW